MTIHEYRANVASSALPFSALDSDGDGTGEATPRAEWVGIPGGSAGNSVTIKTWYKGETKIFTVGSDGVCSWPVPEGIRTVTAMSGVTLVQIGTGSPPVSIAPQGVKGDKGDKGDTGDAGADGADGDATAYTPDDPTKWATTPPETIAEALDRIAAVVGTPVAIP